MNKLQPWEVNNLLDEIKYSNMNEWEQTRMLMYITAQVNSTKKINVKDILNFPWDNVEHDYNIKNSDINRLKEKSKRISEKYIK